MIRLVILSVSVLLLAPCSVLYSGEMVPPTAGPNVVFILADDLGWADTTLYGHTTLYETPNIERLAARGMTFTRAYAASPLCSPTRAAILTGLSPARTGITAPACHLPKAALEARPGTSAPPPVMAVQPQTATRLKTEHDTLAEALRDAGYAAGHFGKWHLGPEPYSPLEHGFDVDVPHWPGPGPAGSYVAPWRFPDFDPAAPNEHIEDRMAKEAVAFLEKHREGPFLLNYWMFSVHAPFDAKPDLIEKYRGQVDASDAQRSPTYAAMVESMDDAVGTLLDTLDRLGVAQQTVIVFTSDNGGNMYNEVDGTTPTSNRPLRGGKATVYEGGVRVPCVIVWPGVVEAGARSDAVVQSCDFYPTILDMLGLKPRPGQKFDGASLVPALLGRRVERRPIFTYFPHDPKVPDWLPPSISVHEGDWKLIRIFHGADGRGHRWKLFNLADDVGETKDVAADNPRRVEEMDALIEQFLSEANAIVPRPNPDFDPARHRPENEGKPALRRRGGPRGKQTQDGPASSSVAGWKPSGDCSLAVEDGALVITSTGNDPYLRFHFPQRVAAGTYEAELTMSSNGGGRGQFFWQQQGVRPPFFRDRSVVFDIVHDGNAHTYRVRFTAAHPLTAVRLDPGQAEGKARLLRMKLSGAKGALLFDWRFSAPP